MYTKNRELNDAYSRYLFIFANDCVYDFFPFLLFRYSLCLLYAHHKSFFDKLCVYRLAIFPIFFLQLDFDLCVYVRFFVGFDLFIIVYLLILTIFNRCQLRRTFIVTTF